MKRLGKNQTIRRGAKAARRAVPSRLELREQVTELLEQQAAISEVLRAIASSPHELQPIFDTILADAIRLCRANLGVLLLFEKEEFRIVARQGQPTPNPERSVVLPVHPGSPFARLVENRAPVHTADLRADESYLRRIPGIVAAVELVGARTHLLVPMLKEDELIGAIAIFRVRVQPFTDKQIALITDFAAQATIALESIRRERQHRELQMELAHAHRVATMGQLTASIAHEVRQPLAAMVAHGNASLRWLARHPPEIEEAKQCVECIINDVNRASDVIGRIHGLVKKNAPRKDPLDINDAILEVITLIQSEAMKNGVSVRTQLTDHLPQIQGDRVQLQQVMLNLIINAIQAISGLAQGIRELHISTENTESEGVRVTVRDSGPGLSAENLQRLFEPFYTTKPNGMGMGLSICRSIIEDHEGRLWAAGHEPQGALFQFTIPTDLGGRS